MAYSFWASCQSPAPDLRRIRSNVARNRDADCAAIGFAAAFRHRNPAADESAIFDYVLECWREIGGVLGVDDTEATEP